MSKLQYIWQTLKGWWRANRCLDAHEPVDKMLYLKFDSYGREFLEGRDCTRCGREAFCMSLVDQEVVIQPFPRMDASHAGFIGPPVMLSPEEAKGYHRRRLESRGYTVVDARTSQPHARRRPPLAFERRRLGAHS